MKEDFWLLLGYILITFNTLSVVILLEMIFLGRPYITLFLLILYIVYKINRKMFTKKRKTQIASVTP